jgi:hypothetical protein
MTATTKDPLLQPLARFASALLIQSRQSLTRIQLHHIPGVDNDEADALSRYTNGRLTSWADVTRQCSRLRTCRICLLPRKLLSVLADLSSSRPIEGTFAEVTTSLLIPELNCPMARISRSYEAVCFQFNYGPDDRHSRCFSS